MGGHVWVCAYRGANLRGAGGQGQGMGRGAMERAGQGGAGRQGCKGKGRLDCAARLGLSVTNPRSEAMSENRAKDRLSSGGCWADDVGDSGAGETTGGQGSPTARPENAPVHRLPCRKRPTPSGHSEPLADGRSGSQCMRSRLVLTARVAGAGSMTNLGNDGPGARVTTGACGTQARGELDACLAMCSRALGPWAFRERE